VLIIASGTLAIHGILQFFGLLKVNGLFRLTGSFDNPAGFAICLSAGFPVCLYHLSRKGKCSKITGGIIGLLIIFAVVLSGSRAGVLNLIVISVIGAFQYFSITLKIKHTVFFVFFFLLVILGMYFLKKDSADGRLLIWNCSWNMIMDKPFFGFGFNGFKANYMYYQAAYFRRFPDSQFIMLADNISRPFNEYILLLVNFGVLGLFVLSTFVHLIVKLYRQRKSSLSLYAIQTLIGIAVLAVFSYPLVYPHVWYLLFLSVGILFIDSKIDFHLAVRKQKISSILIGSTMILICVPIYRYMGDSQGWTQIVNTTSHVSLGDIKNQYDKLWPRMKQNDLFLYNYAAEMNYRRQYSLSLDIAMKASSGWADYNLQLIMAHNYQQLRQYRDAEFHYRLASEMCPNRFLPLYGLLTTYEFSRENEKVLETAKAIIEKPVKVPSNTVDRIKQKAMELCKSRNEM
jgi:hypothetical protein